MDLEGTRYAAICGMNGFRNEIIHARNMNKFVKSLLRSFRQETGQIPVRILYFRDGVSENQYSAVISHELADIYQACAELQQDYCPKVTVTIVAKRHHTRFFPLDSVAKDRNANATPGVIVERDATHPSEYDFCMLFSLAQVLILVLVSHCALQGTAKPVHYHVIHDDNRIPVDAFQAL